jgi:hypothetical protein
MPLFRRRRPQLQPFDEAAAYARCHGERSDEIVRIAALPPPEPPQPARELTGESLRKAFEDRLRGRAT